MTTKQRSRLLPAVAAAMIAAGGVVWVAENGGLPIGVDTDERGRVISGEIRTNGTALMVFVVDSAWRGRILNVNTSVSQLYSDSVELLPGEPVEAVLIGRQEPQSSRRKIECNLYFDGTLAKHDEKIVRSNEETKEVTCRFG